MCKEKLGIQIFSNGFMLGKFFPLSEVTVCTVSLIESSKLMVFALPLEQICSPTGQSGIIGISVLPEKARLPDDERQ